jgi:hypothetical protein
MSVTRVSDKAVLSLAVGPNGRILASCGIANALSLWVDIDVSVANQRYRWRRRRARYHGYGIPCRSVGSGQRAVLPRVRSSIAQWQNASIHSSQGWQRPLLCIVNVLIGQAITAVNWHHGGNCKFALAARESCCRSDGKEKSGGLIGITLNLSAVKPLPSARKGPVRWVA